MRLGVAVTVSAIVMAAGLTATPSAQELQFPCDVNLDGTVTAERSQVYAAQRFDLARGGADALAEERFAAALLDADGLRRQFGQADQDGDGRVTREEWLQWFGAAYAGTTEGAGSRSLGSD